MLPPVIPDCESPVLLINRAALNQIALGGSLYISGEVHPKYNQHSIFSITHREIFSLLPLVEHPDTSPFVVRNGSYEDYLFVRVPCGNCNICRSKKQNDLVWRAAMESSCYDSPPMFFTLTYSDKHLPYHGELRYKDVQNFFKRLRKRWSSRGLSHNIRYIVAGEYGKLRGRPHYHVIMFNNPYHCSENQPKEFRQLREDVFLSWGLCERSGFDFGQCGSGAASYTTKYMCKVNPPLHGHWTKPFIHSSCGSGGIGSPLIDQFIKYLRSNPELRSLTFRDYDGHVNSVLFSSYLQSRIWPTPLRTVPPNIRHLYKQYCDLVHQLVSVGLYDPEHGRKLMEIIRPYKSVVPNRFSKLECKKRYVCPTFSKLLLNRYSKILDSLSFDLSEVHDVDSAYIELYNTFKDYTLPSETPDIAWKLMNARQRAKVSESKEKL